MKEFRKQILDSFTTVAEYREVNSKTGCVEKRERKLTSSLIENKNRMLRIIKNNANGYKSWNRVLWCLIKDVPLHE